MLYFSLEFIILKKGEGYDCTIGTGYMSVLWRGCGA